MSEEEEAFDEVEEEEEEDAFHCQRIKKRAKERNENQRAVYVSRCNDMSIQEEYCLCLF